MSTLRSAQNSGMLENSDQVIRRFALVYKAVVLKKAGQLCRSFTLGNSQHPKVHSGIVHAICSLCLNTDSVTVHKFRGGGSWPETVAYGSSVGTRLLCGMRLNCVDVGSLVLFLGQSERIYAI